LLPLLLLPTPVAGACPPLSCLRSDLLELRARDFRIDNSSTREALALALLDCLADPDPVLRDQIAFEALSTWMRGGRLSNRTATEILDVLLPRLTGDYPDPQGFGKPFSALVLAEVARMDRLVSFLSDARLDALLDVSVAFLNGVTDYRAFDEREGWRHGVAHGADLLLQLSLNPRVGKIDLDRMLSALASQVAPAGEHFYTYGEPERLARAVYYIASRDLHSEDEWTRWFERITDPEPLQDWPDALRSQEGLAKRHNTASFLVALYLMVDRTGDAFAEPVRPGLLEAIDRVP
jgi:hypothetical protein